MEDTVKTRRNPLAWFSKHKKLTALLLVVLIAAVLVLRAVLGGKKAAGSTYQFVRTSTLQKTSLTDSVSVNGTVKSGYEASVTVADSAKLYKVSEVKVAVGDTVKKGDVIATLDTSDLEKQIESAQESYGDTLKSAQTSYDRATADLETSTVQHENSLIDLQAKIDQAYQNLQDAKDALTKAQENERKTQSTYDTAVSDYNTLKSAYDSASASISTYTAALNAAADAQNQAISAVNSAIAAYNADPNKDAMNAANDNLKSAQEAYQSAQASLTDAQNSCSAPSLGLYGFNNISDALKNADSTKNQAESALDSAKNAVEYLRAAGQSSPRQLRPGEELLQPAEQIPECGGQRYQAGAGPAYPGQSGNTAQHPGGLHPDCHDGRHHHGAECYRWFGLQRHRGYHPEYRCTGGGRDHSRQQRA